jgi:protein phosphatase
MKYQFFSLTDPGRVRTNNEDALTFDEANGVAVLADGMGGYNAGEVASGMATAFIGSELVRWLSSGTQKPNAGQVARALDICVQKANTSILNAAVSNPHYAGMGTTLVAAVFQGQTLVLGHVGDSRCYRLRAGVLTQLTKDHSMLQEQVDAGLLTPEQAAVAPGKNLLTRALGVEDTVQMEVATHQVTGGDLYLMCSDGLTDMLDVTGITSVLTSERSFSQMAQELIHQANAHGGRDNIAVLLTKAMLSPAKSGLMSVLFGKSE